LELLRQSPALDVMGDGPLFEWASGPAAFAVAGVLSISFRLGGLACWIPNVRVSTEHRR